MFVPATAEKFLNVLISTMSSRDILYFEGN